MTALRSVFWLRDDDEKTVRKYRVSHDRDREVWERSGFTLGPVEYREFPQDGRLCGEWRSPVTT